MTSCGVNSGLGVQDVMRAASSMDNGQVFSVDSVFSGVFAK